MATLEGFPAELVLLIAQHIKTGERRIARLALVSRRWQANIESISFAKLSICASELHEFSQSLNRTRFLALRDLKYRIDDVLPGEPIDTTSVRIRADACAKYSDTFTQSIRNLFTVLKDKCDEFNLEDSHPGLALHLISTGFVSKGSLYLEEDNGHGSQDMTSDSGEESDAVQCSEDNKIVGSDDAEYDEYGPESSLTRAWLGLTGEPLPIVSVVTRFTNDGQRHAGSMRLFQMVWPPSWSCIASCLPNVKAISMYACDDERRDRHGRRVARNG
jgi:hypothetical protein